MSSLLESCRLALRRLGQSPAFTVTVVALLGLGIGGATAMFTVLDTVLLHPLPLKEPERLVLVRAPYSPYGDPEEWWERAPSLERLGQYWTGGVNLSTGGHAERVNAAVVSANFFSVLAVAPERGRTFLLEDETPGRNRIAALSHGLWVRQFGGRADLLGEAINLNGIPHTVVAVMPAGFGFPGRTEVWVPRSSDGHGGALAIGYDEQPDVPSSLREAFVGRLRPGATLVQARVEIDFLFRQLQTTYAEPARFGDGASVHSIQEVLVGNFRLALWALFAAVALVLLIACANAANLLLARAVMRQKEVAIRLCLGAGGGRIVMQFLAEALLLAAAAAALGILLAHGGLQLIRAFGPANVPRLAEIELNLASLGFAVGVCLFVTVAVGLAPALQAARADLNISLKEEAFRSTGAFGRRARGALVVAQVALTLMLLSAAGLATQSLDRLTRIHPGFDAENLLTLQVVLPREKYFGPLAKPADETAAARDHQAMEKTPERAKREGTALVVAFYQQAREAIGSLPGVVAVGAVEPLPLSTEALGYLWLGGEDGSDYGTVRTYDVSGEYFRALGIPVLQGRVFNESDAEDAPRVVIINQTLAQRHWPGGDAVGRHVTLSTWEGPWWEIVGVVGDTKNSFLGELPEPQFYMSHRQSPSGIPTLGMVLVVRTTSEPQALAEAIQSRILEIDKDLPVFRVKTMEEVLAESSAPYRFRGVLLGLFALLAVVLAVTGVNGLVAYSVRSRTHEIGVRMALGAQPRRILLMVLGEGTRLALVGVAVGLIAAWWLNQLISKLLFGVSPADPVTFALASILLLAATAMAALVPAFRASKLAPARILKYE